MAVNESPVGTYADATGVVDATAAAEIAAFKVTLYTLIPTSAGVAGSPDFLNIPPAAAEQLRAEIDAVFAAIAAAPTS